MRQLKIEEVEMKISGVNLRSEKHGDEEVPATDINLEANMPLSILNQISVDEINWGDMLWKEDDEMKGHCITNINFHREYQDQELHVYVNEDEPIKFSEVTIKRVKAEPVPGRRVILKLQAQVHPDKEQNGELSYALHEHVRVDILPSKQADIED